jgi:2-keto-3-deoxy-6-phosphogluconate aldolase
VLIVRKRDTGRMNALRGKGVTKRFSNWSDGAGAPCHPTPPEPMLTLQLGGKSVKFLCDTVAAYSVIKRSEGPLSKGKVFIQGATGTQQVYHWSEGQITNLGGGTMLILFW